MIAGRTERVKKKTCRGSLGAKRSLLTRFQKESDQGSHQDRGKRDSRGKEDLQRDRTHELAQARIKGGRKKSVWIPIPPNVAGRREELKNIRPQ